jgi:hypothetical protein
MTQRLLLLWELKILNDQKNHKEIPIMILLRHEGFLIGIKKYI